jgi:hypothetical protein
MRSTWPLAAAALLTGTMAMADPGYYLVTVYENQGEANIDYRYWTVKLPGSTETIWPEIGLGSGVTKRWYTEVYASYIGSSNMATRLSSLNWQNDYLLTQGQYDFDLALHTDLIYKYCGGGHAFEYGPALQTDVGRVQLNANLIFERPFDTPTAQPTQLKYQWQAKYRWRPEFQFGLQGFGELGPWDNWAPRGRRSHRAGPMIAGSLPIGATDAFKYQAAFLKGSVYGTRGHMWSMRLQYVF